MNEIVCSMYLIAVSALQAFPIPVPPNYWLNVSSTFSVLVHAENKSKHSRMFVNGCELSSCIADCYSPNIPFSLGPGESKSITVLLERPHIEEMTEENWQGFCKNLRFEKSGLDITKPMPMYIRLFTSESETPRSVPISISVKKEFVDGLVTRGFSNHHSERDVAQSK